MQELDMPLTGRGGTRLKPVVLQRIIAVMTNPANDGKSQKDVAALAHVSPRTLTNYLTPAVWAHIRTLRLDVMSRSLQEIDQAVYAKAVGGDVSAAKLIFTPGGSRKENAASKWTFLPGQERWKK